MNNGIKSLEKVLTELRKRDKLLSYCLAYGGNPNYVFQGKSDIFGDERRRKGKSGNLVILNKEV